MSNVDVTVKKDGLRNQLYAAKDAQPDEVAFDKNAYGVGVEVEAHHLIPTAEAAKFEPFFQTLSNHSDGALVYIQDHPNNGVFLPKDPTVGESGPNYAAQHRGSHPAYSEFVRGRLENIQKDYEAKIKALEFEFQNDTTDPDFLDARKGLAAEAF
jgi:hypothetical protein